MSVTYSQKTERLRAFSEFLGMDTLCGADRKDPDLLTAHNLAVEAAFKAIRHLAIETCTTSKSSSPKESQQDSSEKASPPVLDGQKSAA